MTELYVAPLTMPGARLGEENPLPFFRERSSDRAVAAHPSLPAEKRLRLGWQTGFRVLPYRMQDSYTRQRTLITFSSIVLENEILKATFLPELGGRLISLFHKDEQRELLCRNPVFQPANLAIRNAWFSGGIEWNIGQLGHTFSTCAPVFAARITGAAGEPGLRLYDFERCKQLFWQIDFYLPAGSPWLIAHTRILNPNAVDTSVYWWTNIAVPERPGVRVLAPARQAIYTDMAGEGFNLAYGDLPHLPTFAGQDATYSLNAGSASEFFFQCDQAELPWEAALDPDGCGLIEASTSRLGYRKLFCWGTHQGGRHWQEFLSPGGEPYLEIQAGLAPTQLHGLNMPAGADWHWTQVFGHIRVDPQNAHDPDWEVAWQAVDAALKTGLPIDKMLSLDSEYAEKSDLPAEGLLFTASGWGALELLRRRRSGQTQPLSPAFDFPDSSLGPAQSGWLALLHTGCLPEQHPSAMPEEWLVQAEWRTLLKASLEFPENCNWYALLHLGVMCLESFDPQGARSAWLASLELRPSALAWRNLAVLAQLRGDAVEALECQSKAWQLDSAAGWPTLALAREYLAALNSAHQYEQAQAIFTRLPEVFRKDDRIQILRGRFALELGNWPAVDEVMQGDYAVVREGETELTDIWFEMWSRRIAAYASQLDSEETRVQVRQHYPPPARIDFRRIAR